MPCVKVFVKINGKEFDLCDTGLSHTRFCLYHALTLYKSDSSIFDSCDVWVNNELLRGKDDVWYGLEDRDVITIKEKAIREQQCA
ncbi:MAG: hypothetical protein LR008_00025 [Candidatus Pacebacteria bacterium]|nr:hypothetical protein [Candidatus Paceibacterota bacterium]